MKLWFVSVYSFDFRSETLFFTVRQNLLFICLLIVAKTDDRWSIVIEYLKLILLISQHNEVGDFCLPYPF